MPADPDGRRDEAGSPGDRARGPARDDAPDPGSDALPVIRVRPAGSDDADRLLAWANDPLTRAAGFHLRPIGVAEHRAWLAGRLASASTRLFVGLVDEEPVGQVRLERDEAGVVEVSISVAPEARGQGVGRRLLDAGLEAGRTDPSFAAGTFVARVRSDNAGSLRLFDRAGFREVERILVDGQACVVLRRA